MGSVAEPVASHQKVMLQAFIEAFLAIQFSGNPRHARRISQLTDWERTRELPELPAG